MYQATDVLNKVQLFYNKRHTYTSVLKLPMDGTPVTKHVGVLRFECY